MEIQREKIGGMLLESITGGLYDGNLNSIREYVQNSIDAQSRRIEIFFENGYENLIIRDDGSGMNLDDIREAFGIGVSKKSGAESNIGWRGIGIWSGIPISERIVFITKRRGYPKYRIQIDCNLLRPRILKEKDIFSAIKDATSDTVEEPLGIGESLEGSHYTIVRYESIVTDQRFFFKKDNVKEYLCKNVPAPFDNSLFDKGEEVTTWLEEKGILSPRFVITFEGEIIRRAPFIADIYMNFITYKEFWGKSGELIAVGWFLNKKVVERRGRVGWPEYGIYFKKKGFTIGDERLIERIVSESYRLWQYGEIHVVSPNILENSQRDSFEYNGGVVHEFYDQIQDYFKELDRLDRYRSDHNAAAHLKKARSALKTNERDVLVEAIQKGLKKVNAPRKPPKDPSMAPILAEIEANIQKDEKELNEILNSVNSESRNESNGGYSPSSLVDNLKDSNTVIQTPDGGKDDLNPLNFSNMSGKAFYKYIIANGHSEVKNAFSKFKLDSVTDLEVNVTNSLRVALQKKMGINGSSDDIEANEVIALSKAAFGWGNINLSNKDPLLTISPELRIIPDKSGHRRYEPYTEATRNMEFGVMIHAVHDLFTNFAKHKKDTEAFKWYEGLSEDEKFRILGQLAAALTIIHTLIDHCEKIKSEAS